MTKRINYLTNSRDCSLTQEARVSPQVSIFVKVDSWSVWLRLLIISL